MTTAFVACALPPCLQKREYGLLTYQSCFVGSHLIDWLVDNGKCDSRAAATEMGRRLQAFDFLDHVAGDHHFEDKFLYYRFYTDTLNSDRGFIEFTKLEQGLAYLGHLDRGQQLRTLPPLPPKAATDVLASAGQVDPAQFSVDSMKLEVGFHFEGSTAPPPGMESDSDSDGGGSPLPVRASMIKRTSETLKSKKWLVSPMISSLLASTARGRPTFYKLAVHTTNGGPSLLQVPRRSRSRPDGQAVPEAWERVRRCAFSLAQRKRPARSLC